MGYFECLASQSVATPYIVWHRVCWEASRGRGFLPIAQWKRQAIECRAGTLSGTRASKTTISPADVEKLHAKIDQFLETPDYRVR